MAKHNVQIDINADDNASAKMRGVKTSALDLKDAFKKIGMAAAAAGAAMAAAAGKALHDWTELGDQFDKMAKRTGVSVESLSELRYIAQLSGTSIEGLGDGIIKMQRRLEKAGQGLKTYTRALETIGLTYGDLEMLSPEEQFFKIARAIAEAETQQEKILTATELFGVNTGANLLPMLEAGAEAFEAMRQEAHDANVTFTEEGAAAAAKLNDRWTEMQESINGLKYTIAEKLAPSLTELIDDQIKPAIQRLQDWVEENPKVIEGLLGMVVAIGKVAMVVGNLIDKLVKIGEWISKHKGLWETLSVMMPHIFWPRNIQEEVFGGMGGGARATPEAQRLAEGRTERLAPQVNVNVEGSVWTGWELATVLRDILGESSRTETFLKNTPHGTAYRTSP